MSETTKATHTPGPLLAEYSQVVSSYFGTVIAECRYGQTKQNARLLAAAYNSYDKHCGERAVECAEADLLGELIDQAKDAIDTMEQVAIWMDQVALPGLGDDSDGGNCLLGGLNLKIHEIQSVLKKAKEQ